MDSVPEEDVTPPNVFNCLDCMELCIPTTFLPFLPFYWQQIQVNGPSYKCQLASVSRSSGYVNVHQSNEHESVCGHIALYIDVVFKEVCEGYTRAKH